MPRRLKKILFYAGGSVFALLLITWLLATIYHDEVRLKAEQVIDKEFDATVTFDHVGITLFQDFPNLTITLHDLVVASTGEFEGDTLAIVDEFDLEIKTASLWWGQETELKSIHMRDPRLFLKVHKNGKSNYNIFVSDSLKSSKALKDSSVLSIALDEVKMSNGMVEYRNEKLKAFMLMRGVDHTGKGDFRKELFDFETLTTVKEFDLDYEGVKFLSRKEVDVDLAMQLNMRENSVTLKRNNIRINHFNLALEGSFGLSEDGYDIDLSFNAKEGDFKDVISLIPGIFMEDFKQISTKGQLAFNGFVSGTYSPKKGIIPSLLVDIKVLDAMFKIDSLPDPIENIQMDLLITNLYGYRDSMTFNLKNFQFDLRRHPVRGRFKIQGLDHYKVDADIVANVDLAELERMYPVKGLELKGAVDFELKTKGKFISDHTGFKQLPVFNLNMMVRNGKLKYDSLPAALDSIQFHLIAHNKSGNLEKTVFDFRNFHLDFDKNRLHGFIKLEGFEELKVKTDIKADLDLADIERLFPTPGLVMKGNLSLDVEAEGLYSKAQRKFPSVDAKLELVNGFLQNESYPEPLENVHLSGEAVNSTGKFSDTRLAINKLTYTLEKEVFEVRGTVSDLDHYDYDLKVKGTIDLEKLTRISPIEGTKLSGTIFSDIETRGRLSEIEQGRYDKTVSGGKIEIRNLVVQHRVLPKPLTISQASYTFTPSKIILEKMYGKFGKSSFTMTGDLSNYMSFATRSNDLVKCDLNLRCDTLDLNEWLSEKKVISTITDTGHKITVWQVPTNLDAVFDSEIAHVRYEDMRVTKLDGEIRIKDGVLTLHETGFNSLNAFFSISGNYNTRDLKHPRFDVDLDIKELDISKAYNEMKLIRDLVPAAADADGMFSVKYKLKGELNQDLNPKLETLSGRGEMRISNAKINGMKVFEELSKASKKQEVNDPHLRDFVLRSEIRDSKIIVKPFSMKVSGFEADIEGVSEISGAIRYLVKMELLPFGVKVPFHVTGTYDNPKVALGKGHVLYASDSLAGSK